LRGRYGNDNDVLGMYDKARKKRLENQKLEANAKFVTSLENENVEDSK
jgi:hypothetical protein